MILASPETLKRLRKIKSAGIFPSTAGGNALLRQSAFWKTESKGPKDEDNPLDKKGPPRGMPLAVKAAAMHRMDFVWVDNLAAYVDMAGTCFSAASSRIGLISGTYIPIGLGTPAGDGLEAGGPGSGCHGPNCGRPSLQQADPDRAKWPEHIKALRVPPAWTDVQINPDPKGALLVVGRDAKGRAQYVYSKEFADSQAAAKFARIKELDDKFKGIQRENEAAIKSGNENAACLQLVMKMGIRPGSDTDTKAEKKAYGATTLQGRHVVTEGDKTYLQFVGKKGVSLKLEVPDEQLANSLKQRAAEAGPDGRLFPGVTDGSLLDHTHSLNGGDFKTKDFRTLLGTSTAMKEIAKMPAPKNEKEYKKSVKEVAKTVSTRLGNTPTIALQSYINPVVFGEWRMGLAA